MHFFNENNKKTKHKTKIKRKNEKGKSEKTKNMFLTPSPCGLFENSSLETPFFLRFFFKSTNND